MDLSNILSIRIKYYDSVATKYNIANLGLMHNQVFSCLLFIPVPIKVKNDICNFLVVWSIVNFNFIL